MFPSPWVVTLAHKGVGERGREEGKEERMKLLEPSFWNPDMDRPFLFFLTSSPLSFLFFSFFLFSPAGTELFLTFWSGKIYLKKIPCFSVKGSPRWIISSKLQALNDRVEQLSSHCSLCICACVYAFVVLWSQWVSSSLEFKKRFWRSGYRRSRRVGTDLACLK